MVTAVVMSGCKEKAAEEIDVGTITNSVYENKYFGMTVELPPDWAVQGQDSRQEPMDVGGELLAGDDKNLKATLKASELSTVNLFASFQHPRGTPVPFNPSILCVAERVRHLPGIKTGNDYFFHMKKLFEASQMEIHISDDVGTETISGRTFDILRTETPLGLDPTVVHQKYYVSIMKGYALAIIASYTTDAEDLILKGVIDSITFQ